MYYVFEGPDGSGKSTAIKNVADILASQGIPVECTRLPGATDLGNMLRELVKREVCYDENGGEVHVAISQALTRQLLFATDYADFIYTFFDKLVSKEVVVLVDRCSAISSLVYGNADGNISLGILHDVYKNIPNPVADSLFLFSIDSDTSRRRMLERGDDYFDHKGEAFKQKVRDSYESLLDSDSELYAYTGHLYSEIISVSKEYSPVEVAQFISGLIIVDRRYHERGWPRTGYRERGCPTPYRR
jgi:dTMP kinase